MTNVILVEKLRKSYKSKVVVDDLCFSVKKGEFFGLLGNNGAGKSTTIDCILGLKNFESGKVRILDMNPKKSRKELFERVGVQLQSSSYQDKIKVYELWEEIYVLYNEADDYNRLLKEFSLEKMKNNFPMLFLSGATIPFSILPDGLQKISNILPLTQGIKLLKGYALGLEVNLTMPILVMAISIVITVILSIDDWLTEIQFPVRSIK